MCMFLISPVTALFTSSSSSGGGSGLNTQSTTQSTHLHTTHLHIYTIYTSIHLYIVHKKKRKFFTGLEEPVLPYLVNYTHNDP